ncbi:ubiquinol-cytochrome C chaperone family protein [Novosphingobium sp.]|uniref:ubiquinol-cytochrome C chaperone family protein n=1 Tax=Novosphingobium sp. TaxID=1874826 RepID=UPI001ECA9C01|nr:ubiquinol-cytochrome C chaperone family protein [Novosphingobium sp.]MBK6802023.1 hypothetical protein [Novosphingobium sp.]MBK9009366.1 hypothetical protein [Novosphingobium sp.]
MGLIARLLGRKEDEHAAVRPLWQAAVRIARTPDWYARGGIADTVPGRFDALSMVMALILLRMEASKALRAEPARLTELFVTEMDGTLRQQGVGDLVVGKRVGKLMSALGGRIEAYRSGLASNDASVLEDAVRRNVTFTETGDLAWIATEVSRLAAALAETDDASLLAGRIAR